MPGDLRGITITDQERGLLSFGMMAVEIYSKNDEKLQIGNGKAVEISFPLPADLHAAAPSIIPLWYFDTDDGLWKEEGSARLQNGKYVGEVKHFSFWNCDDPYTLVSMEGKIVDLNGNPLAGKWVRMTIVNSPSPSSGFGYTDNNGVFKGKIPKNKELQVIVKNNCGDIVHDEIIGPFPDDVILSDIIIDPNGQKTIHFTGTLTDCNSAVPISNGYIEIQADNIKYTIFPRAGW